MSMYLSIPSKKTYEVDINKPLNSYIARAFKDYKSSDYQPAVKEFNKLRSTLVTKSLDKTESALDLFKRYYDQLIAIEAKFPLVENEVRIAFKWQSVFDKESMFAGKKTLTISNGKYEKACILFNIASIQCQLAESKDHKSDDGLKSSAKLFMASSSVFLYLSEQISGLVGSATPTIDLHPDFLATASCLMLAQAQDCFCRKAINDNMKPDMIAKLCLQCSDFYADTMQVMQRETVRSIWPKDWLPSVTSKQACFHALSEMYDALRLEKNKDFGQEISRLTHAMELMNAGESRGGPSHFIFPSEKHRISQRLVVAKKDNDFIYHERVPSVTNMPSVDKLAVAKRNSNVCNETMSTNFKDLFEKMLPLCIHNSLTEFDSQKKQLVANCSLKLKEGTNLLDAILASLNLPASLEDFGGNIAPHSLLEKAAKVRSEGGTDKLETLIEALPDKITCNKEILRECQSLLEQEEKTDNELREKFKTNWTRTKSAPLAAPLKAEITKFQNLLNQASDSDNLIRKRFSDNKSGFSILSKSDQEITDHLPNGSPMADLQNCEVVRDLRAHMTSVGDIKVARNKLVDDIENQQMDITPLLLKYLNESGQLQFDVSAHLKNSFAPYCELVEDSLKAQADLLQVIQKDNVKFASMKLSNSSAESREQRLVELACAYDCFSQIHFNLKEGTKFYSDISELLLSLQTKIKDFCFARKTEKDDLMQDIRRQIANKPMRSPPSPVQNYQHPTAAPATPTSIPQTHAQQSPAQQTNVPPVQMPMPYMPAPAYNTPYYGAPTYQPYPVQNPYGQMPQYPPQAGQYPVPGAPAQPGAPGQQAPSYAPPGTQPGYPPQANQPYNPNYQR